MSNPEAIVRDIVLVPGAWHGGWCWDLVSAELEQRDLCVHALTLPGLAERAAELSAEIGLQSQIDDAIAQLETLGLNNFVLVGHSYGGMIITAIADKLKDRIAHIIYLDAALPINGESMVSYGEPRPEEEFVKAEHALRGLAPDGIAMKPFDPSLLGIPDDHEHYEWVLKSLTPHPLKTWLDPISLENEGPEGVPATYVLCTEPLMPRTQFSWTAKRLQEKPHWSVKELATGHDAMITDPLATARIIIEAALKT
ncbi:MAG: alpha/beta hydrolase [Pseudomonadota bacterium]